MDKLDSLLTHSAPSTSVFHTGQLSHALAVPMHKTCGHLHVLHYGQLRIGLGNGRALEVSEPSIVLFPRPMACELAPVVGRVGEPNMEQGQGHSVEAQLVCAHVDFGHAMAATLARSIPQALVVPLHQSAQLAACAHLVLGEAHGQSCGRRTALEHLMNYFLVLLIRHLMEQGVTDGGVLAAMAHPRLSVAITAMHDAPQQGWTLESLADAAGMSRVSFANTFRQTTGLTVLGYLTTWRMGVAKSLLRQGKSLKEITPKVGYGSAQALIRSFAKLEHISPKAWLVAQERRNS